MLTLEESGLAKQASSTASALVVASPLDVDDPPIDFASSPMYNGGKSLTTVTPAKSMVVGVAAGAAVVAADVAVVGLNNPPDSQREASSGRTAATGVLGSGRGLGHPLPALIQQVLHIGPGPPYWARPNSIWRPSPTAARARGFGTPSSSALMSHINIGIS